MKCPVCRSTSTYTFYYVGKRPLSVSALQPTAHQSVNLPSYPIDMAVCDVCTHVFNAAFDPSVDQYSGDGCTMYNAGEAWAAHVDRVVEYAEQIPRGRVVEIGAGDGEFLARLSGPKIAYEPSSDAEKIDAKGIECIQRYYIPGQGPINDGDLIIMRHVLEHIHQPAEFLDAVATSYRDSGFTADMLIEVPCCEKAIKQCRVEDWTYEHPNHFTQASLRALFMLTGLEVVRLVTTYDSEVLLAHVRIRSTYHASGVITSFQGVRHIKTSLPEYVIFWGGAGKSTMILHEYAVESDRVVDSDERKWGKYVPGLSLKIESPDIIKEYSHVIITTNWREKDILADMRRRGLKPAKVYTIKNGELHESSLTGEDS